MIHFRTPLVGGVFSIGLMFQLASIDIVHAAPMVEASGRHDAALIRLADNETPAWAAPAKMNPDYNSDDAATPQTQDDTAPTPSSDETTADSDKSSDSTPAWAAPAKMNPDYTNDQSTEPGSTEPGAAPNSGSSDATAADSDKSSASTPAWAEPAKMNPDYSNDQSTEPAAVPDSSNSDATAADSDKSSGSTPAWAAPAKMNPDYSNDESATPAPAAEETPSPSTGEATTAPSTPAWAEPAKMNPDYDAAETPAPSGSSSGASACIADVTASAGAVKVHFSEDSSALSREDRAALNALAKSLKDCGGASVEVQGYTDNVGSSQANQMLSALRAKKVADLLASAGVDDSKLKSVGYGPDKPIGDNETAEGRRQNRRIELVVSGQ